MANNITRATAQVAPFLEAISQAREAGLTWGDIALRLGIQNPDRVRWAAGHCRYKAAQIPLPEAPPAPPQPQPPAPVRQNQPHPRPLPGRQKKTDAQALADLAAAGVTVVD